LPAAEGTVTDVLVADHVRNLDWNSQRVELAASVEVLTDVRERLRELLGL